MGDKPFIYKRIYSDLDRALISISKQRNFVSIDLGVGVKVEAVDIYEVNNNGDHLEILMPYVEGVVAAEYAIKGTRAMGEIVSQSLSILLYKELSQSVDDVLNLDIIKSKIKDIYGKTTCEELKNIICKSHEYFSSINKSIIYPRGICHGDLTLSNIIFSIGGGCRLIDFLNCFVESPLQDVAKIRQEFDYGWSFRKMDSTSRVKAKIFCKTFLPRAVCDLERLYPKAAEIFAHMALLRICPYVSDAVTQKWLLDSLNFSMKKLENKNAKK